MKRYIMTLIAFSLSVMVINGTEKSDGIDAFPYRDLIENMSLLLTLTNRKTLS